MTKISNWLKSWWVGAFVSRQLSASVTRIGVIATQHKKDLRRLNARESELNALTARVKTDVQSANRTILRLDSALEEEREKVRVLETTIRTLVASHRLLLERYDAETAIEVRRRVAATSSLRE